MTLKDCLHEAADYLKQKNVEDPSKEAGLLLSWVLGKDLAFVYAHPDLDLDEENRRKFCSTVERRGSQEPYAYIIGQCEFMSLTFDVNPNVLIPRADTELLAETALAAMGTPNPFYRETMFKLPPKEAYRVLDIGTGSGCLSVSIARYAALSGISAHVDGVDISPEALKTALGNAQKHCVASRMHFIQADFLSNISMLRGKYDLIVSNPPYIPSADIGALMPSVRNFEPRSALDGGRDGLLFYRELAYKVSSLLLPEGILAVECGFDQASQIQSLFSDKKMETLILKDLAGISRVVAARAL